MNTMTRSSFATVLRVLFGLFVLFIGHRMVVFELHIKNAEKNLLQTVHPEGTEQVDTLVLEVNDYPAAYVDDSIQFQSAVLVGEIRRYAGNSAALETFYAEKRVDSDDVDRLPVRIVPLQIEYNDQRKWLDFPDDFSFDPFQADILQALQDHYPSNKLTGQFGEPERNLYFVYRFAEQ